MGCPGRSRLAAFLQEREELEFPEKGADLTQINCKFLNKHLETKWGLKVGLPGRSGVILLLSKAMPGDGGNARWRGKCQVAGSSLRFFPCATHTWRTHTTAQGGKRK